MSSNIAIEQKQVIATLSLTKSLAALFGICVLLLVGYSPFLLGRPWEYLASRPGWSVGIVLAWIGLIFFVILFWAIARQLLCFGRAAIWLENGTLYYLHSRHFALKVADIEHVYFQSYPSLGFNYCMMQFQTIAGTIKSVPCAYLSEPKEVVMQRLTEALKFTK